MTLLHRDMPTGRRTVRGLAADHRILGALEDGPLTANEIADKLRREVWDAWAERHGYDFEWETDQEPFGARLLAFSEADEMGLPYLYSHQVYPRLRGLERRGEVERIQIKGRKPMLFLAPPNTTRRTDGAAMTTLSKPGPRTEIVKEGWFYLATYLQGVYGDARRKPEDQSPQCSLFVRRVQVRRGPSGKERSVVDTDVIEFPNEAAMVEWIDAHTAEELPAEADGNPSYVPEGFRV